MDKSFIYNDILIDKSQYNQKFTDNQIHKLNQIYGYNGDVSNKCISLSLVFNNINNISNYVIKDIKRSINDTYTDKTLSVFKQENIDNKTMCYLIISSINEGDFSSFNIDTVINSLNILLNNAYTIAQNKSYRTLLININVQPDIVKIITNPDDTINVYTVGLYCNIGLKNDEMDNYLYKSNNISIDIEYLSLTNLIISLLTVDNRILKTVTYGG